MNFISLHFSICEIFDSFHFSFCEIVGEFHFISKSEILGNFREFQSEMKRYIYIYTFSVSLPVGHREKSGGLTLCPPHTFLFSMTMQKSEK
jgi:hypothetical protein